MVWGPFLLLTGALIWGLNFGPGAPKGPLGAQGPRTHPDPAELEDLSAQNGLHRVALEGLPRALEGPKSALRGPEVAPSWP